MDPTEEQGGVRGEISAESPEIQPDEIEAPKPETIEEIDEDKEPGGASPQEVRARKEYRLRKQIEREREEDRRRIAALEGQITALREPVKKPEEEPLSPDQVWEMADRGETSERQAVRYEVQYQSWQANREADRRRVEEEIGRAHV